MSDGTLSKFTALSAAVHLTGLAGRRMTYRSTLLGSAALLCITSPAVAQPAPPPSQTPADTSAPQAAPSASQPAPSATQQPANAPTAQADTSAAQAVDQDFGD